MTDATAGATTGTTTLTVPGAVVILLTDIADWQRPVGEAARLAAATGRRLRVVLADSSELLTAASLDCVKLLASGGMVSGFDAREARRLLRAQTARLRHELERLAAGLAIEIELIEATASNEAGIWTGSTALTVFGRRRRGIIMVVHAGTGATLEVAARLATERRQGVRLLSAAVALDPAALDRLFGPWLAGGAEPLAETSVLRRPGGAEPIAALVVDPAWAARHGLTLDALLRQWLTLRATAGG